MKKILGILVCGILLISLTGCGNSKATITDNNGEVNELSLKEIENIYNKNSVKFENNYSGAKIEFKGTIESISDQISCEIVDTVCRKVTFTNGWYVYLLDNIEDINYQKETWVSSTPYDFMSFDVGDTLQITSKIVKKSDEIIIGDIEQKNTYHPDTGILIHTRTENTIVKK